jgi:hypothetical protein
VTPSPEDVPGKEKVGSAAEEAAKLAAALQDFARRTTGEHIATGSPECRLCPICQLISFARDTNPAVVEHLVNATESLAAALRAAMPGYQAGPRQGPSSGHPGVQHIDIK